MAARLEPILTIADLEAMPEDGNRYELVEGELFVSCAPNLIHQGISANLMFFFGQYLRENPIGKVFPGPGVIFSDFSGVIPDAVYVSNRMRKEIPAGDKITGAPDLIIEILSPRVVRDLPDNRQESPRHLQLRSEHRKLIGGCIGSQTLYRTW